MSLYVSIRLITFFAVGLLACFSGRAQVMVKDILPGPYNGAAPTYLTELDGALLFLATDTPGFNFARELWRSDGTAEGTYIVKEILGWDGAIAAGDGLVKAGAFVYFAANDGAHGRELWRSDGTADGTIMIADIAPGAGGSDPKMLTPKGDTLFCYANDLVHGRELWMYTLAAGATLVKDIRPGAGSSFLGNTGRWATAGGLLYFAANDSANGLELWRTDGTATGTVMVSNASSGSGVGYGLMPKILTAHGGEIYFAATGWGTGEELYKSDGTTAGTLMVKDLVPGYAASEPRSLYSHGGYLYFVANTPAAGRELWRTDGTETGTMLLADANPGAAHGISLYGNSLATQALASLGSLVYFGAFDSAGQHDIWKTDGTPTGTQPVTQTGVLPPAPNPAILYTANDRIYFQGYDTAHRRELWQTDGTAAGTDMIADIDPDTMSSNPRNFCWANGALYFSAGYEYYAAELWRLGPAASVSGGPAAQAAQPIAYPVPTWDVLYIQPAAEESRYSLCDLQGRVLCAGPLVGPVPVAVDVRGLVPGIYVVRIGGVAARVQVVR